MGVVGPRVQDDGDLAPALTGVLFMGIVSGSMFSRLREIGGLPATLTAWLAVMGSTAVWFLVMLSLPRR